MVAWQLLRCLAYTGGPLKTFIKFLVVFSFVLGGCRAACFLGVGRSPVGSSLSLSTHGFLGLVPDLGTAHAAHFGSTRFGENRVVQ